MCLIVSLLIMADTWTRHHQIHPLNLVCAVLSVVVILGLAAAGDSKT